jgi:hypothetical protein
MPTHALVDELASDIVKLDWVKTILLALILEGIGVADAEGISLEPYERFEPAVMRVATARGHRAVQVATSRSRPLSRTDRGSTDPDTQPPDSGTTSPKLRGFRCRLAGFEVSGDGPRQRSHGAAGGGGPSRRTWLSVPCWRAAVRGLAGWARPSSRTRRVASYIAVGERAVGASLAFEIDRRDATPSPEATSARS